MTRPTRPISWMNAALKAFHSFPEDAQSICLAALTIAADGGKADTTKPMKGMGSGVFEIALPFRGNAFQKKSTQGIKTPKHEIDLIHERLTRLKEALR